MAVDSPSNTWVADGMPAALLRHWPLAVLGVILVATAALYAPMFGQWFQSDDFMFVNAGQDADAVSYIRDVFDFRSAPPLPEGRFYRPLHSTAFVFLYDVFGLHAWGYHLWSLVVHLGSTVFVWLIARRLTKSELTAALAASFFALHPAHVSAVGWISNNNALMATCVSLAAFWCFLRAQDGERLRRVWYGASVFGYAASLLLHPEVGSLLVALIAYRFFVQLDDWRRALEWRRWLDLTPFVAVAAVYFAIQRWMTSQGHLPQADEFAFGWHMLRVFFGYVSMSVYPTPADQHALPTWRHVLAAVALSLAIVALLAMRSRRRPYVAAFAVVWYAAALAPLSTAYFPDFLVDISARKLYVAGPALALVLALLVTPLIELAARQREQLLAAAGTGALLLLLVGYVLAGRLVVDRQEDLAWASDQSEAYVRALQEAHPTIPEGSRLHVVGLPAYLAILTGFYDEYVVSLVGMHYQGIEVVVERDTAFEQDLGPSDVVFRYQAGGPASQEAAGP